MTSPISSIQGLASGIKWQDMIDQLIQVDTTNQLTPVQNKSAADTKTMNAWTSYGSLVSALETSAKGLADGSAFGAVTTSVAPSPTTGKTLVSAFANSSAVPGSYRVQVLGLASSQQLSGNSVSDASAALGISGQMIVGGKVVSVSGTDSLNSLRDKINALNTSDSPSGVTASILHVGASDSRLVLSSDSGGSNGVDIRDARATSSDPSVLAQLGFTDGSSTMRVGSDGATRSASFGSASQKIAAMALGVSVFPSPATVTINGRTVTVDLATQSLAEIAAMINAQAPNTASVESISGDNGTTSYRLKISGQVAATNAAGSQPVLDILGLSRGSTPAVQQKVATSNVLKDGNSAVATSASLLLGLNIAGTGAAIGDKFTISGTKADGVTPVSFTETVDGTKTVNDFLNDLSTAFSASGRTVTAAINGGKIELTDVSGGDSALSFSISTNNAGGGALSFGATSTTAVGRERELDAGADARVLVNGVLVTSGSNTITSAISGVTLTLNQAEEDTTIPLTISRDTNGAVQALQNFATSYNSVQNFVASQTGSDGALAYNGAVRQSFNSIKNTLLGNVSGLASGAAYTNAASVGVALDKNGKLTIDATALTAALNKNADAVKALFQTNGATTGANLSYVSAGSSTASGAYDIAITRAATQSQITSSAVNFTYAGNVGDTLTLTDTGNRKSGSITLANGDAPSTVADKLNTMFQSQGLRLSASSANGALKITSLDYGSTPGFTVDYSSSDVGTKIGIASGTYRTGLDVQGSFKSGTTTYAATGSGQLLTGNTGTPVSGLLMRYAGSADVATGHVDFAVGVGGLANRIADAISNTGGVVSQQTASLQSQINDLAQRQASVQSRLDARRAALTAQFTAMETALQQLQAQGSWLTSQISSLNGSLQTSSS